MNIYIGNLPYSISETEVQAMFEDFGAVDSVKIVIDRDSGRSKGFGFVEMADDEAAQQAIEGLGGTEIDGRKVFVNQARERSNDRRGGGGYRQNNRGGGNNWNNNRGGNSWDNNSY